MQSQIDGDSRNFASMLDLSVPLVVDLDDTLIKTDLLFETTNQFVTRHPFKVIRIVEWFLSGKPTLKSHLAECCPIDAATLPYNPLLLQWLKENKSRGRVLILATASHKILADTVAAFLGFFDEVLATDGSTNLKAHKKRDVLVERFGVGGFDYVGNDISDLPIWQSARQAHIVGSSTGLVSKILEFGNLGRVFDTNRPALAKTILEALRPHQWIKNVLVFVPLLAAHQYVHWQSVWLSFIAFLVFGLTASSVYLLNDLIDLNHDRHHHRKRNRPFAAGNLSLLVGWALFPCLLVAAFLVAGIYLPLPFVGSLAAYFVLTSAYSLHLKQIPMLDVLTLAGLYTLRIIAGAAAIGVHLSFWLLTFSMFIFLSLAFIKRFNELKAVRLHGSKAKILGRGYFHEDLELVSSLGTTAGYLGVLVLALYIQDSHTAELYNTPQTIWLACPLLLYWISRAWIISHRGQMHDDPIVFALKDKVSWIIGACFIAIFALARFVV